MNVYHTIMPNRPINVAAREASSCTKAPEFECRVRYGCHPWPHQKLSGSVLVDRKCQVQSPVELVDLAVRSFL